MHDSGIVLTTKEMENDKMENDIIEAKRHKIAVIIGIELFVLAHGFLDETPSGSITRRNKSEYYERVLIMDV